jgi:hypothetical protein
MEALAESGDNGAGASISVFILSKSSEQATSAWGLTSSDGRLSGMERSNCVCDRNWMLVIRCVQRLIV